MARVDLLLTAPSKQAPIRVGAIGENAPFMVMFVDGATANLPLPVNITSANQILWEQADTTSGAGGSLALKAMENVAGGKYGDALVAAKNAIAATTHDSVVAQVGAAAGILNAPDLIHHKAGKAVNPNKEMMFNGVGYRSFTFEFEFIPLDEDEASSVIDFIEMFQEKAMPGFADGNKTYFKYPPAWDIRFSGTAPSMPLILPAYLTDYSINYGGVGKMVFHEDSVVQTNITLTFTEAELHMKEKVTQGYIG